MAGNLLAAFTVMAVGTWLQVDTPDSREPTALEQALIEHACGATRVATAPGSDAYEECLHAQLSSMRADFGRDLSRLSASERRKIDSECNKARAGLGREAYLECLSAQLSSLHNRRSRAHPAPPEDSAPPSPEVSPPSASPIPPPPRVAARASGVWIAAAIVGAFTAVGAVLLALKARRAPTTTCRVCGADVPERGDLCQKCRHEAAESLRRAAAERAEQLQAQEEEQRRQREGEEEQRRQKSRQDEEARLRQQEEARQREEDARLREEAARQRNQAGVGSQQAPVASREVFDPYAVLGVPRDAGREVIDAAYRAAKVKYDPDQVAGFGYELQEHYKSKAQAVERAYQILTE